MAHSGCSAVSPLTSVGGQKADLRAQISKRGDRMTRTPLYEAANRVAWVNRIGPNRGDPDCQKLVIEFDDTPVERQFGKLGEMARLPMGGGGWWVERTTLRTIPATRSPSPASVHSHPSPGSAPPGSSTAQRGSASRRAGRHSRRASTGLRRSGPRRPARPARS